MIKADQKSPDQDSYLTGLRVLEVGGELVEYCGRMLAGLGASVVKVEPPAGEHTRTYGPFLDDVKDVNGSLHFWHYNVGKKSVALDTDTADGQRELVSMASLADIVLDGRTAGDLKRNGLEYDAIRAVNPKVIYLEMTEFGSRGPWSNYTGSDIVHLALGGVMMNCGYDSDTAGQYDTPPIAPQMEQSYHIAGEMALMAVLAAAFYRTRTGEGQLIAANVHSSVSANTETDVPDWVFLRQPHYRQTCRHSTAASTSPAIARTRDGRWMLPYSTYLKGMEDGLIGTVSVLTKNGVPGQSLGTTGMHSAGQTDLQIREQVRHAVADLVEKTSFDDHLWRDGQDVGLAWAPVRKPEENLTDPHWRARSVFRRIRHPELDREFDYVISRWVGSDGAWRDLKRPPLLGEDAVADVILSWDKPSAGVVHSEKRQRRTVSKRGKPFALEGVRVLDLGWIVASAGAGRFLSALGAEVIKVEHQSRWDGLRWGMGAYPAGGRTRRDKARTPLESVDWDSPNRSGAFMEINAGKLGISLNLKTMAGKGVLRQLIERADVIIEGFSPGTLRRMGFGWETLQAINPRLIYVQQSGFGEQGTYGRARAFGPTAQAFSGLTEMSGLPEPYAPAGIGYSYLDWFGAYNVANAILAGLNQRERTLIGCHIDASQGEVGLHLTGSAILNYSANRRPWHRYGNRSPFKPAAPHGAYRVLGEDRWIAIGCFTPAHWSALLDVLGEPPWAESPRFATLSSRLANAGELDALVEQETQVRDGYELMESLQLLGIPAGVCQTAEDRVERDPQLAEYGWQVELDQEEIGLWPVREFPVELSRTPAYMGGRFNRSGPSYGQDTEYVLRDILAMTTDQIELLRSENAL